MKNFSVPEFYRSPIISEVKKRRKIEDPRKKDFNPTKIIFSNNKNTIEFLLARHFGFCYGVENAIEIAYKAIEENKGKRIFLLSQMIHNPGVNEDLKQRGLQFIQDTQGKQIIPWSEIKAEDIVIIPAFGTTIEIEEKLTKIGVDIKTYNTTCPFVEKVWNRSEKLGNDNFTIIIHGKHDHEETRATFSHSNKLSKSLVIKDIKEAAVLCQIILGFIPKEEFYSFFAGKFSQGFDVEKDLEKIALVNQTTMLASETKDINELLSQAIEEKYGIENKVKHIADTRDTLCYATNDNQSSNLQLLSEEADFALTIGGYNSSNTTHLVELLEQKFTTYFIEGPDKIIDHSTIDYYDINSKSEKRANEFIPKKDKLRIIISSGASCPDSIVDVVMRKILSLKELSLDEMKIIL